MNDAPSAGNSTATATGCLTCDQQQMDVLPAREDIVRTNHWRVAHAFNSTLPGWLVVLANHHVLTLADLNTDAAAELGVLLHHLSQALIRVTGCAKTYLMQFSDADGFAHLHLHVVPRMPNIPDDSKGPRIFTYLVNDQARWLPERERDAIALSIREALNSL